MDMHTPPMFMKPSFVPQGGSSQGYQLGKNFSYIEFDFFFFHLLIIVLVALTDKSLILGKLK